MLVQFQQVDPFLYVDLFIFCYEHLSPVYPQTNLVLCCNQVSLSVPNQINVWLAMSRDTGSVCLIRSSIVGWIDTDSADKTCININIELSQTKQDMRLLYGGFSANAGECRASTNSCCTFFARWFFANRLKIDSDETYLNLSN